MNNYDPNHVEEKVFARVGQKAIILNPEGKILVLQRSNKAGVGGKWALAGGQINYDEDPVEGIKREIQEETGLTVEEVKPYMTRSYRNDNKEFVVMIGYVAKVSSGDIKLNWEHDTYTWVTKEEALQMDLTEDGKFFIDNFQE